MTKEKKIGDKIMYLRESLGLKRPELGERLGIEYQTLYKYETNQRMPDLGVINRLAHYFGVSTDYLLGNEVGVPEADKRRIDVRHICDEIDLYLHGDPLPEEEKQRLRLAIRVLFPYSN